MIRVGDTVWIVQRIDVPDELPATMRLSDKARYFYVYYASEAECQRRCEELMQERGELGIVYKPHPVRLVGVQQERLL